MASHVLPGSGRRMIGRQPSPSTLPHLHLAMAPPDIASSLRDLLATKLDVESWQWLSAEMLQESLPSLDASTDAAVTHLRTRVAHGVNNIAMTEAYDDCGVSNRPFYLTVARTLQYCFDHDGSLPPCLVTNPIPLLAITNQDRLNSMQAEMAKIARTLDMQVLDTFLFKFLTPSDWRILLHIRTTTGSLDFKVMPPSLDECLVSFVCVHEKKNAKPRRSGQPYQLSVGAKALSKHWHRDRQVQFWGVCTGTEVEKNKHAEDVMIKILNDIVWINMHSLPHDETVYEVRQSQGYGMRWILRDGESWEFRGFLEPQMVDGHSSGWVH